MDTKRIYRNHHIDNTRWGDYVPRDDDIVISTSIKSGTTWTQSIVRELIVHGLSDEERQRPELIPLPDSGSSWWLEATWSRDLETMHAQLEAQQHRRSIKSHIPFDGVPYYPQVKYLVIGRDPRDVFMSLWNHYRNYQEDFYKRIDELPYVLGGSFPRCPDDIHDFWHSWINKGWFDWEHEGYPFWGNMHHVQTWWDVRERPNVGLFHYGDMLTDTAGEIARMAEFLEIDVSAESVDSIVEYTSLSAMRQRKQAAGGSHGV